MISKLAVAISATLAILATESTVTAPAAPYSSPVFAVQSGNQSAAQPVTDAMRAHENWAHFKLCPENEKAITTAELVVCPSHVLEGVVSNRNAVVTSVPNATAQLYVKPVANPQKIGICADTQGSYYHYASLISSDGGKTYRPYASDYCDNGVHAAGTWHVAWMFTHRDATKSITLSYGLQNAPREAKWWPFY